ncbi:MAG: MiaB/RimO family radical SAM methylthiotransferase [Elusimicrobia bacterium]|nr:MiaB/RimO family radical SAM methylthiotransferase [Elusimicrobiota bacterium]
MKVYVTSFGCRVNQYEGERVREGFVRRGALFTPDYHEADVCVVNTCSVTDNADKDARRLLRKIGRDNPAAKLVITGCYASRAPGELQDLFPQALIVGNEGKDSIPALADCSMGLGTDGRAISSFYGHTRAYIKVQDGCNMRCTYCIIPSTRPAMESRPVAEILAEIEGLLRAGYKEFVLCGIRLGRYWDRSADPDGKSVDLPGLIERIAALDGDFRIRLSSIEITDLTDRFLAAYAKTPKTVPYFHLPLQSGSDAVLASMKRWYGTRFYGERIEAARRSLGQSLAIFTDLMIGFPSETGELFDESLAFARKIGFAGMHIFRFSSRQGTPAASMENVVDVLELDRRFKDSHALDGELRAAFAGRFIGRQLRVLWEEAALEGLKGHAENFLPVVEMRQGRDQSPRANEWQTVTINHADGSRLIASHA